MSGPKDYTVGLGVGLLEMMAARAAAERSARQAAARRVIAGHAAAVRGSLGREAAAGASAAAGEQTARAAETRASMEANRQRAAAARQQAERTATPPPAVAPPPPVAAAMPDPAIDRATDRAAELAGWREVLAGDQAVSDFAAADAAAWAARAAAATGPEADALLAEAQAIHDRAGTLKGQFDARNELLAAVIASFHEIGFHVDEPFFEQPGNPAGAVVLKASSGSDTVESTIDLSDHIRTVWGGAESDHCKDSFFDFARKMKDRGLDVKADRADLQDRPTLLQKSANELPQAGRAGG